MILNIESTNYHYFFFSEHMNNAFMIINSLFIFVGIMQSKTRLCIASLFTTDCAKTNKSNNWVPTEILV